MQEKLEKNVRKTEWIGKTVYEICEYVESEIKKRGAKCAFPVNTSINEVAAHYTAEPNDEMTITDNDLVKIDLGAQIDGYIADTAVTVCYNPEFDSLVQGAESALKNAMSMMKVGVKSSDVGRTIEKTIKDLGLLPIANLSGHSSRAVYYSCRKISSKYLVNWLIYISRRTSICVRAICNNRRWTRICP